MVASPGVAGQAPEQYPLGRYPPSDMLRESLLIASQLLQFLAFYATLPTHEELAQRSAQALARVDVWAADQAALADRAPARSIVANLKCAIRQSKS